MTDAPAITDSTNEQTSDETVNIPAEPGSLAILGWLVGAPRRQLSRDDHDERDPRLMVEFDVTARAAQWLSTYFMRRWP